MQTLASGIILLIMTSTQIAKAQTRSQIPFTAALRIREVLDAARKEYGPTRYDDEDIESQIIELVTSEGDEG